MALGLTTGRGSSACTAGLRRDWVRRASPRTEAPTPRAKLHHVGELQALLAHRVAEGVHVGHHFFAEAFLILGAVEVRIDFRVVALFLQDREVVQHLRLVLRSAAEKVFEVELDEAVGVAVLKELRLVEAAFRHLAHELTHREIPALEQGFRPLQPLAGHHVLVAEHLAVHGPDQGLLVVFSGVRPVFLVAGAGETLDAQIGSVGESHGREPGGERRGEGGTRQDAGGALPLRSAGQAGEMRAVRPTG